MEADPQVAQPHSLQPQLAVSRCFILLYQKAANQSEQRIDLKIWNPLVLNRDDDDDDDEVSAVGRWCSDSKLDNWFGQIMINRI